MRPFQAHQKARRAIEEASSGCDVDVALKRFAERILEHYEGLQDKSMDGGYCRARDYDDFRHYFEEDV